MGRKRLWSTVEYKRTLEERENGAQQVWLRSVFAASSTFLERCGRGWQLLIYLF